MRKEMLTAANVKIIILPLEVQLLNWHFQEDSAILNLLNYLLSTNWESGTDLPVDSATHSGPSSKQDRESSCFHWVYILGEEE